MRQVLERGLTAKQVESVINQVELSGTMNDSESLPSNVTRFTKAFLKGIESIDAHQLWKSMLEEKGDKEIARAYLMRLARLAEDAAKDIQDK